MTGRLRAHWPLGVILLLYLGLGVAYGLVNPPFEGHDEEAHFRYVRWLATRHSLPVFAEGPSYEAFQPPLYYALGALVSGWIDTSDLDDLTSRRNPYWPYAIGEVGNDNKNQYLHGPWENFPFRKTILALHVVRWLSLLIGAVTVGAAYALAAEIFPAHPYLALGTAALVGLNPEFLYVNSSITNDGLVAALTTVTMLVVLRGVRRGWTTRTGALLGGLTALAILTELSALILLPLIGLAAAVEVWRTRDTKRVFRYLAVGAGVTLMLSGWWFLRNWVLYRDWTGIERMRDIIGRYAAPLTLADVRVAIANIELSYWAFFGWNNVPVAASIYLGLRLVTRVALIGLLLALYRERHRIRPGTIAFQLLLIVAWAGLTGIAVAYYISGTPAATYGRNLFIAGPALSLLMFLGLWHLCPRRLRPVGTWLAVAAMACLALVCLVFYLAPAYARPPVMAADDLPSISHPLDVRYGDEVALRGYDLDRTDVHPGETLRVTFYWEVLQPIERDYSVFVQLFGREQRGIGQRDTYPGLGNLPTSQWQPGTIVVDTVPVPVSPEAEAPALVRIDAGLYELETLTRLPASDAAGRPVGSTIGTVRLLPWQTPVYTPSRVVDFNLGDQVTLTGYTVEMLPPDQRRLDVTLYWQAQRRPDMDYVVFLHLVDAQGRLVQQKDEQPLAADYPTSHWMPAEPVADRHQISLQGVAPGRFELWVGMYDLGSGQRLPVYDAAGRRLADDRISLGTIVVSDGR